MKAIDAIERVLADAGGPLHSCEIARRALESGIWQTSGLTPDATINARLVVDINSQGAASRFQRTGPNEFALRRWGLPEVAPRGRRRGVPELPAAGAGPQSSPASFNDPSASDAPNVAAASQLSSSPAGEAAAPSLSFTDAAETVLEASGRQEPMHYRAITDVALALGLVSTRGLTPEHSLYAQVLTETKRRGRRGEAPRFVMHGKGFIGLAKWQGAGLAFLIEQHNQQVRKELHEQLFSMPAHEFEALIGELLTALGFENVERTPLSGDGGIDVRGTLVVGEVIRTRMAVQVKRWRRNVQAPIVQQVRGSLGTHEQGLIVTTGDFSHGARAEAERANAVPVALLNGEQLVRLLVENDIGVHRASYDLIDLGEDE
jgi:restriction system protein